MATKSLQRRKPRIPDVALSLEALDGNEHPLDMDMRDIDPDPTSLDLPLPGKPDNLSAAGTGAARGVVAGGPLRHRHVLGFDKCGGTLSH